MIDVSNCRKKFIEYVKTFDMKEPAIMGKFHHSFRVMNYAYEIAKSLHLNEEDQKLASIIGLYHDIGRFTQWTEYGTYEDQKSIDHADLGVKLIQDQFITILSDNIEIQNIICKSIQNHSKLYMEEHMNEKEILFSKIIRDADKLDIMIEQNNKILTKNPTLNTHFISSILKHQLCQNQYMRNCDEDSILRQLAFLFDLNFLYTYRWLQNKEIIEKKLKLLETNFPQEKQISMIKETLLNYLQEKCKAVEQ